MSYTMEPARETPTASVGNSRTELVSPTSPKGQPVARQTVMGFRSKLKQKLRIRNDLVRECLAEFIGTFILISFGDGSVAQSVLSKQTHGTFLSINWAWGLAVAMGVWWSGGVSGGHINPAVSLANCIMGRLAWYKFPFYAIMQYLGAFAASACVYGVYLDALNNFDGGKRVVVGTNATAGIWATYPKAFVSTQTGFGDQIFGTALLVGCILAVTDEKNMKPPKGLVPLCVGLVVAVIGMSYGFNCGYAINPARDLGPRIFTLIAGWGVGVFSFREHLWFWVPVVACHIGAILGAFLYLLFIGIHLPDPEEEEEGMDYKVYSHIPRVNADMEMQHRTRLEDNTVDVPPVDYMKQ